MCPWLLLNRLNLTGSYSINIPGQAKFFAFSVTPSALGRIARIVLTKDGVTGVFTNHVQIHDATSPYTPMDGDFSFIAVERSGP